MNRNEFIKELEKIGWKLVDERNSKYQKNQDFIISVGNDSITIDFIVFGTYDRKGYISRDFEGFLEFIRKR